MTAAERIEKRTQIDTNGSRFGRGKRNSRTKSHVYLFKGMFSFSDGTFLQVVFHPLALSVYYFAIYRKEILPSCLSRGRSNCLDKNTKRGSAVALTCSVSSVLKFRTFLETTACSIANYLVTDSCPPFLFTGLPCILSFPAERFEIEEVYSSCQGRCQIYTTRHLAISEE